MPKQPTLLGKNDLNLTIKERTKMRERRLFYLGLYGLFPTLKLSQVGGSISLTKLIGLAGCFLISINVASAKSFHYFFGNQGYKEAVYDSPEAAGQNTCVNKYNNTYGRLDVNPAWDGTSSPYGFLYCDIGGGQVQGKGNINVIICPDWAGQVWFKPYFYCPLVNPDLPSINHGCGGVGNPCNASNGNKFQSETDFSYQSGSFVRSYNSGNLADLNLGRGWRSNFQRRLIISGNSLIAASGRGQGDPWQKSGSVWVSLSASKSKLTQDANGYTLTRLDGTVENYNNSGMLLSIIDTRGGTTSFQYDLANQLVLVENQYGHQIQFEYEGIVLKTAIDTLGQLYRYEYDSERNLTKVVYPDSTPQDDTDNPYRQYHYENLDFPNHLTGITDENGDRIATYAYDANGKAIVTEHAQTTNPVGQERFELDYQGAN